MFLAVKGGRPERKADNCHLGTDCLEYAGASAVCDRDSLSPQFTNHPNIDIIQSELQVSSLNKELNDTFW
jgi:hypothetical protein